MRKLLHILTLTLAGCFAPDNTDTSLTYVQDVRTGMCFAIADGVGTHGQRGISHVPCTQEVLHLVQCARIVSQDDAQRCQGAIPPPRPGATDGTKEIP